jgi:hypothetical protein
MKETEGDICTQARFLYKEWVWGKAGAQVQVFYLGSWEDCTSPVHLLLDFSLILVIIIIFWWRGVGSGLYWNDMSSKKAEEADRLWLISLWNTWAHRYTHVHVSRLLRADVHTQVSMLLKFSVIHWKGAGQGEEADIPASSLVM